MEAKKQIVEQQWEFIKTTIKKATSVLGERRKLIRRAWFDEECKEPIEARIKAYRYYMARRTRERQTNYEAERRRTDKICK